MLRLSFRVIFVLLMMSSNCLFAQVLSQGNGNAAKDYINIYQKYLSGLKNTHCSMYPSCSNYAKMVFSDYPFTVALVKTADRLIRCGHDLSVYPISYINDFVSAVDFPDSREIPDNVIHQTPLPISCGSIQLKDSLDTEIQFINNLINKHSFYIALLEIERLLYYQPERVKNKPVVYVDLLKCYEGLKEYNKAVMEYETRFPSSIKNDYKVLYSIAHIYDLMGDFHKSIDLFNQASSRITFDESAHPYGELALLYTNTSEHEKAKEALNLKYMIDNNKSSYDSSLSAINELCEAKLKKPGIAMSLSVIPGLGYIYTNQPKNALTALVINGVLAYSTYTSFKNKNYGLGGVLGALSISFYLGNISGSRSSAQRYNQSLKTNSLGLLRELNPYIN